MLLISYLKDRKRRKKYLLKWRQNYPNSSTTPLFMYDMSRITIGNGSYGPLNVLLTGDEGKLSIGQYCSMGKGVVFCL